MKTNRYSVFKIIDMFGYNHPIVQEDLERIYTADLPWERLNGKSIFITGANSMLGTYVAYFFLYLARVKSLQVKTVVLTRSPEKTKYLYAPFLETPFFGMVCQDVVSPILYEGSADYIFHFAGNASPAFINNDPVGILKSNLLGTFQVMELAKEKHAQRVLFASTREVYGAVEAASLTETTFGSLDPMEGRSCYPESKRAAESILQGYCIQYGMDAVSVRIAHCYGPGMKIEGDGRVMSDFISDAVHGRDIVLKSSGTAIRAFCYITDAVIGMLQVLFKGQSGEAYNLANETEPMPIREVASLVCQAVPEKQIHVTFGKEKSGAGYCKYPRVALDTAKIASLGFVPQVALKEGIRRTLESFFKNLTV